MIPAEERLGTDELTGDQAQLRLIGENELATLHSLGERLFGIDLALMLCSEFVIEQAMLPAAKSLGVIHGNIGSPHQGFDRVAMVGADRNADRCADIDAVPVELERLGNGDCDPPCNAFDFCRRRNLRERRV